MSTASPAAEQDLASEAAADSGWVACALAAVERRFSKAVDGANPILVKETRQALKSRQFVVTFVVVLIACWVVTFGGIAFVGPGIYYAAAGPKLLVAYFGILAFPLLLIVPYSAFRSLAAEQEENTYDLLSITTIGSNQVVTGKLQSALVQMLVYLCAVSPCLAFTFLLRGVDALTVAVLLAALVLESIGLSLVALLVGAIARARNTHVFVSVGLVLMLFWVFTGSVGIAGATITQGPFFLRERLFWTGAFAFLTLYATTCGLIHAAASAVIAFSSENRSTALRRWMVIQQACFCGWIGGPAYYFWNQEQELAWLLCGGAAAAAAYWFTMGSFLTGEWPHLSRRVQRTLPQTALGRLFLSLFNPGPGSGYAFVVANLSMLTVAGLGILAWRSWTGADGGVANRAWYALVFGWSYVTAFLGFGRLLINLMRRWFYVPLTAASLTHTILLLTGIGVPTVYQLMSRQLRNSGYSLIQASNPFWTFHDLLSRGPDAVQAETLIWILPPAAVAALLLNVRSIGAELAHQRIAAPARVAEDAAADWAAQHSGPGNPWDSEAPAQNMAPRVET